MYWKPIDSCVEKEMEVAAAWCYLENDILITDDYSDPSFTSSSTSVRDSSLCCDVCAKKYSTSLV